MVYVQLYLELDAKLTYSSVVLDPMGAIIVRSWHP